MAYITPELVTSPRGAISDLRVVRDGGESDWSLARMKWYGKDCWAMRWNGNQDNHGIGNPQSRGVPTWFILPDNVGELINRSLTLLD
jgi:hypothetical protein